MEDIAHDASGPASPKPGDIAPQQTSRPDSPDRSKLRVFISYSRDDLRFADQLNAALNAYGFECFIDREGISGGEDWKRCLGNLIRDADTVVFVLSPSSAGSEICAWEVEESARLGKRILPVVYRPLKGASPPPRLRDLNYIFFYEDPKVSNSGFGTGLAKLVVALNTDFDWLREHTRYLQRATEWDRGGRPANRLLSGEDIAEAKAWAARRPKNAPEPTTLHLDFIRASEEEAEARSSAQRKQLEAMAAVQAERETALHKAEEALKKAADAQRKRAWLRRAVGVLMLCVIGGLLARIYERELRGGWFWATTFAGKGLSETALRDVKPGDVFGECVDTPSDDQKTHRIRRYCPDMVVVRSGKFMMGEKGERHEVIIAKPFAVSRFAVTFDQWDACVAGGGCDNYRPSALTWGRGTRPVIYVSWQDAQQYTDWLNSMVGTKIYRLLSEAEFEYAARARSTTAYPWGDEIGENNANCEFCKSEWDNKQTAPVGSFKANDFGLYDMQGNVWQWVEDCWHGDFNGAPNNGTAWRTACGSDLYRVVRGGAWNQRQETLRSANRYWGSTGNRSPNLGFRVARTLVAP
jgi:formylglycine-generating enzyme required for sulfatase activity